MVFPSCPECLGDLKRLESESCPFKSQLSNSWPDSAGGSRPSFAAFLPGVPLSFHIWILLVRGRKDGEQAPSPLQPLLARRSPFGTLQRLRWHQASLTVMRATGLLLQRMRKAAPAATNTPLTCLHPTELQHRYSIPPQLWPNLAVPAPPF